MLRHHYIRDKFTQIIDGHISKDENALFFSEKEVQIDTSKWGRRIDIQARVFNYNTRYGKKRDKYFFKPFITIGFDIKTGRDDVRYGTENFVHDYDYYVCPSYLKNYLLGWVDGSCVGVISFDENDEFLIERPAFKKIDGYNMTHPRLPIGTRMPFTIRHGNFAMGFIEP